MSFCEFDVCITQNNNPIKSISAVRDEIFGVCGKITSLSLDGINWHGIDIENKNQHHCLNIDWDTMWTYKRK